MGRNAPIIHLAPIAQELDAGLAKQFPTSLVGVTPQGWMRGWDENGKVFATDRARAVEVGGAEARPVHLCTEARRSWIEQQACVAARSAFQCDAEILQFAAGAHIRMTGENALDQRRARARHADDEDRPMAVVSGTSSRHLRHGFDQRIEQRLVAAEVVVALAAAGAFAGDEMCKCAGEIAEVFARLGDGEIQVHGRDFVAAAFAKQALKAWQ